MASDLLERIVERLRVVIAEQVEVGVDRVTEGASFRRDLGLDSVGALNVLFTIESEFDVGVTAAEIARADSLLAIRKLLEEKLTDKSA